MLCDNLSTSSIKVYIIKYNTKSYFTGRDSIPNLWFSYYSKGRIFAIFLYEILFYNSFNENMFRVKTNDG